MVLGELADLALEEEEALWGTNPLFWAHF